MRDRLRRFFIRANNARVRRWGVRARPEEVLLLLPHCLHRDSCPQAVRRNLDECRRCGACPIAELLRLRDEYAVVSCMVGGGRQAIAQARHKGIRAVVAVACEQELVAGILAAFPKPVYAVINTRPEGSCRNTLANPAEVARALNVFLEGGAQRGNG